MSYLLVFLQFTLIALIAFPFEAPRTDFLPVLLFVSGLLVFAAALWSMGRRTFTVMPEPRAGGELVTAGTYRLVRHPMYLAVLLCGIGAAISYGTAAKWAMLGLLAAGLIAKLRREEKILLVRYPDYAAYRRRTTALVPFIL